MFGAQKCHLSVIQKAVPFWRHRDAQHMDLLLALFQVLHPPCSWPNNVRVGLLRAMVSAGVGLFLAQKSGCIRALVLFPGLQSLHSFR